MSEIRVSAKTLDEAITESLIQLGITSDQLDYKIIEKGSAGFLGIGIKKTVINAWKKEIEPVKEIKEDKVVLKEKIKPAVDIVTEIKNEPKKREKNIAVVSDEAIKASEEFLINVFEAMGMKVEVVSTVDEDGSLSIDIKGENMGLLIGKRGQTLDSLQYLTNRVANKVQNDYIRIKLDTENYRARRKETLENLAKNIAYKVKRTRKSVSLEPMNPYERRIIHSILQEDNYVSTHSEGDEPYRRIVVTLAKNN